MRNYFIYRTSKNGVEYLQFNGQFSKELKATNQLSYLRSEESYRANSIDEANAVLNFLEWTQKDSLYVTWYEIKNGVITSELQTI